MREVDVILDYLGVAEVKVDGFGVPDVQDAVGLGREARHHATASRRQVLLQQIHGIRSDDVAVSFVVLTYSKGLT